MTTPKKPARKTPLFVWIILPLLLPAILYGLIHRAFLSLFFVPYYYVFPDHDTYILDVKGTPHQHQLLAKWRLRYAKLGFVGRIRRAVFRRHRGPAD